MTDIAATHFAPPGLPFRKFYNLATTTSRNVFLGNGVTVEFTTDFAFINADSLVVTLVAAGGAKTVQILNTDYTVAGGLNSVGNPAVGTVTMTTAPATGEVLIVERVQGYTQPAGFSRFGAVPIKIVELALDRITMLTQQLLDRSNRALRYPESEPLATSAKLPAKEDRAGKYLAFDANAEPIAAAVPEGGNVVSTFMATVLDDADAAAARTTLDAEKKIASMSAGEVTTARGGLDAEKKLASMSASELRAALVALTSVNPNFRAHRNGVDQTAVVTATYTKLQLTTEDFDTGSYFDNATNFRYMPLVAGKYDFQLTIRLAAPSDQQVLIAAVYKNGVSYAENLARASGANPLSSTVSASIDLDGVYDFVEFYVYQDAGSNKTVSGASSSTFA